MSAKRLAEYHRLRSRDDRFVDIVEAAESQRVDEDTELTVPVWAIRRMLRWRSAADQRARDIKRLCDAGREIAEIVEEIEA